MAFCISIDNNKIILVYKYELFVLFSEMMPNIPEAPTALHVDWNHGSSLNLTWLFSGRTVDGRSIAKPLFRISYTSIVPPMQKIVSIYTLV
jgi:hypothetical protein